jgi:acyl-CoA synthetase (AMP-forming)/AMP-acid ligase II/thioesterase domain-containing protein
VGVKLSEAISQPLSSRACVRTRCAAIRAIGQFALTAPKSIALLEPGGTSLDYEEIWAHITALAETLEKTGTAATEITAVLLPQGPLQLIAVLGALHYGVCAPLQPRTTIAEVEASLRAMSASTLITTVEFEREAEAARAMGLGVIIAAPGAFPGEWEVRSTVSSMMPTRGSGVIDRDAILLMVTSATTGSAKLVPLTAANLEAGLSARGEGLRITADDRVLLMTSLSHIIGVENALTQLQAGGAVVATGGFDPSAYLEWLRTLRPTWYNCAPTVHQATLVELQRSQASAATSLRFVQSAGAPLPSETKAELEKALGVPVFNDYGMTEACPIAMDAYLDGGRVANSAGRSYGLEIGVLGIASQLLPPGEQGEIVVRGSAVFSGYPDNPEANANAFHQGWFRTGDLGRLDQNGNLFIVGRLKEMINRGGEKVLPGEVDAVVASHPAVLDAAAFAIPHRTLGECVACAVVLRDPINHPISAVEIRRFAAQSLAVFKVPHRICFVDRIPRGELGKPQRWQLTQDHSARNVAATAPSDVTTRKLAYDLEDVFYKLHEIWARVLDREDLGFEEDFFDAGGDSLAAMNMLLEVDERFGSHTSGVAESFLDEPTLEHLTGMVYESPRTPRSRSDSNELRIFPVRQTEAGKQLFCVPADEEEGLYFRRLAKHLDGAMDLSIVRPGNSVYGQELFTFERAGKEMAALLRVAQREGPYLLGGYCYGGIVAAEAARALWNEGHEVRLILFDVPMPGAPTLLRGWRVWVERIRCEWRMFARNQNRHVIAVDFRNIVLRMAWLALIPFRRLLVPIEQNSVVRKLLRVVQVGHFPLYRPRPIEVPVLHFLCQEEPRILSGAARFGWRDMVRRGIREAYVSHDHSNLLHESNLPKISVTILQWCESESD